MCQVEFICTPTYEKRITIKYLWKGKDRDAIRYNTLYTICICICICIHIRYNDTLKATKTHLTLVFSCNRLVHFFRFVANILENFQSYSFFPSPFIASYAACYLLHAFHTHQMYIRDSVVLKHRYEHCTDFANRWRKFYRFRSRENRSQRILHGIKLEKWMCTTQQVR